MVGDSSGYGPLDLEEGSISRHHNAPEDLAGAMGCYPTNGFYEPNLKTRFSRCGKECPSRGQTLRGLTVVMNIFDRRKVDWAGATELDANIQYRQDGV